jgi:NADH-quinone oxidoreductase subunit E
MDVLLLSELKTIQKKEGYVSEDSMKKLSKKIGMPIAKIYAAATFYATIYTKKQGKHVIEICNSPSCHLNGNIDVIDYIQKKLKVKSGETTKNGKFSFHICSCIGCCNESPAMKIGKTVYGNLTKEKVDDILNKLK